MPPNFQNGKVYAIRSHQTQQIYIGSTTQPLSVRFGEHKRMYCSSKEIMKFSDCYIELLEEFPCANKMQLNRREGDLIRTMDCVNKNIAGRTSTEYRDENKQEILEYHKQFYKDNKQDILEKCKQYYQENKNEKIEQSKQYYQDNKQEIKEKKKQYRIDNKQEINKKENLYRENNRQTINEKQNQKYNCCCGGKYTNVHKNRHFKSNNHKEFIRQLSA